MVQARPEAGQISTIWGDWGSGRNGPSLLLCIGELLGWILEGARTARSYGDRTLFPTPVLRGPRTSRRGAIPITGVKRSAFGRLSGRQRPDADEVEGDERRQRRGNGAPASVSRTTGPLRGTRCASSFSVPYASALAAERARPAYETFPCGERRLPLDVRCNRAFAATVLRPSATPDPAPSKLSNHLAWHADSLASTLKQEGFETI